MKEKRETRDKIIDKDIEDKRYKRASSNSIYLLEKRNKKKIREIVERKREQDRMVDRLHLKDIVKEIMG